MITTKASTKIKLFNKLGLHYNLVADSVYAYRSSAKDPFSSEYLPYIIAGFVSFDMSRMMGADSKSRYDVNAGGFATKLKYKLELIKPYINHLMNARLDSINMKDERDNIMTAFEMLSSAGDGRLNQRKGNNHFYVGATKILHFINPYFFIIVDSNASRAFRSCHKINFLNSTQPGYTKEKYFDCMEYARADILDYGVEDFMALEEDTPITRIYDKLTFVTGSSLNKDIG